MEESPAGLIPSNVGRSDGSTAPRSQHNGRFPGAMSRRGRSGMTSRRRIFLWFGAVLIAVSIALIVAGATIPNQTAAPTYDPYAGRDADGVPLDALQPPASGSLSDCHVSLGDWQQYADMSSRAEKESLGEEVTNMTPDQVLKAVKGLAPVTLPVYYWVLDSPLHPWSVSFRSATEIQTSMLTASYSAAGISFRIDGVYPIPATDWDVEHCAASDRSSNSLIARLLASVDTVTALHVVVCDPEGVNGATNILGSSNSVLHGETGKDPPSILDQAIFLRRGALWQSRTSLVHQMGHFLGLAHPFPDSQSCKFDADTIIDTPLQYRGSVGCNESLQAPVCVANMTFEQGQLPGNGFMDVTNDTCRQYFAAGQILRMKAMLSMLRPELYKAGLQNKVNATILPFKDAFQSALPSIAIVTRQLSLSATAAIDSSDVSQPQGATNALPAQAIDAAALLTSSLGQASLAIGDSGTTALESCSCIGPGDDEKEFWTGQLDNAYVIDAIQIIQPWEVVQNNTRIRERATSSPPLVPTPPLKGASNKTMASPPPTAEWGAYAFRDLPGVSAIEIWIGNSPNYWENARCTAGNKQTTFELKKLITRINCKKVSGRFITIRWLPLSIDPSNTTTSTCLCNVAAISNNDAPRQFSAAPISFIPGGLVNVSGATPQQSSLSSTRPAAYALDPSSLLLCSAATGNSQQSIQPWWSMNVGIDAVWIRGIRVIIPERCTGLAVNNKTLPSRAVWNTTGLDCAPHSNVSIDIYITQQPLKTVDNEGIATLIEAPLSSSVCARRVSVAPGRIIDVPCDVGYMYGRVVTIVGRQEDRMVETPLELCNVELIGGKKLILPNVLSSGEQQYIYPKELLSQFTKAIDGNDATCIQAGAPLSSLEASNSTVNGSSNDSLQSGARWEMQLDDSYEVVGIGVVGLALDRPALKNIEVTLADANNVILWQGIVPEDGGIVSLKPAVVARSMRVAGFASLCEVNVLVGNT